MNFATENLVFDPQIIRRFDVNGPRYTSYPTADRFVEAFDSEAAKLWLGKRNIGGISRPLSLYFHIPFCNTICYYCACNKIITKDHGRSAKYLKYLAKELDIQATVAPPYKAPSPAAVLPSIRTLSPTRSRRSTRMSSG